MKIGIAASKKWKGSVRFLLRTCDSSDHRAEKNVQIPKAVGKLVTVSRDKSSGRMEVIVSLGKKAGMTCDTIRRAGGAISTWMCDHHLIQAGVEVIATDCTCKADCIVSLCEGLFLGDYHFTKHKSEKAKRLQLSVDVLVDGSTAGLSALVRQAKHICDGTVLARDWAHEPPNVLNPVTLARRVKALAAKTGLKCTVFDDKQLVRMKMGGIVAVGKGSATPPRLIVLEYAGGKRKSLKKPVVLVGKAITFDTGGYSLKSKDGILGMKYDKCGGMTVIGAMQAVAACKPDVPVVGVIAAAENMIAGNAYRPDDIVTTLSGKTVEIVSADAEGRMVLCDALTYAQQKYKPRCLIDLATLTGGVVIALGAEAAGIFSNNDELQAALMKSGKQVHERLWPLPLWDEYFDLIKGDDSDFKNSAGRWAHAIVGGVFLKQFVDPKVPWAHLDIAGVADVDKSMSYCPKGATGFGVRLLMDYILNGVT